MKRLIALLLIPASCLGANAVYIAQSSAGANDGSSCANAKAVTYFNSSGNWSGSPTGIQIGPNTTVHLCGTFTGSAGGNMLTTQGSGTSGNPVIIKFETGAVLTAPYWGSVNGAIETSGTSYIIVDGGSSCGWVSGALVACNGTITATANGRTLANSQQTKGIHAEACDHCEFRNLNFTNLYVQSYQTACAGSVDNYEVSGVKFQGNGVLIHNNVFDGMGNAMWDNARTGDTGASMYNNDMGNTEVDIVFAPNGTSTSGTTAIHDNHFHDWANWDRDAADPSCYHHNGIHAFSGSSSQGASILNIYNNLFDGVTSLHSHMTGWVYLEGGGSTWGGNAGICYLFNNVGIMTTGTTGGLMFNCSDGHNNVIANNTMVGATGVEADTTGMSIFGGVAGTGQRWNNNAISGTEAYLLIDYDATQVTSFVAGGLDYNVYGDGVTNGLWQWREFSINTDVFATWKTSCATHQTGCDSHSVDHTSTADPLTSLGISSTGRPLSGSPLISAGVNLTSLCSGDLVALCSDISGIARPGSGSWDIGAYQFQAIAGTGTLSGGKLLFGGKMSR